MPLFCPRIPILGSNRPASPEPCLLGNDRATDETQATEKLQVPAASIFRLADVASYIGVFVSYEPRYRRRLRCLYDPI
jgi:hypothetical protein